MRLLFETFRRTGSAMRVVHHFKTEGVLWPRRITKGAHTGELLFGPLEHSRVLGILHPSFVPKKRLHYAEPLW